MKAIKYVVMGVLMLGMSTSVMAQEAELNAAIHLLEDRMSTPEGAADTSLYEKHSRLRAKLDDAETRWLEASEALADL